MASMQIIPDELIIMIMLFLNLKSIGCLSRTSQRYRRIKVQIKKKLAINWFGTSHVHYQWQKECFTFKQANGKFKKLYHYITDGVMYEYSASPDENQIILFVYRTKDSYLAVYDHKGTLIKSSDQRPKKQLALSVVEY